MTKTSDDFIRQLALIGARHRLSELEAAVRETRETIALLSAAKPARVKEKKRRQYTDKFKAEAVAEAKAHGMAATARRLGISPSNILSWRNKK